MLCGHFALEVCVCPWPVKWGAHPSAVYAWCISGCDCVSPVSPPPETPQQGEMNAPFYRWRTRGLGSLCSVPNILQVVSGKDRFEPQAGWPSSSLTITVLCVNKVHTGEETVLPSVAQLRG